MRKLLLAVAALLPALLVAGITVSAANSAAQIVNCSTATACYSPNPIQVTVGSTVTWMNSTSISHTATSDTGAWNTGTLTPGGTSSATTFNTAGTFAYHCNFHPDMHGSVIVSAASVSPAPTPPPVRRLAPGGGGPVLPAGTALVLLGLTLLVMGGLRRHRLQRIREPIDETADQ
jgi:plastocyanin